MADKNIVKKSRIKKSRLLLLILFIIALSVVAYLAYLNFLIYTAPVELEIAYSPIAPDCGVAMNEILALLPDFEDDIQLTVRYLALEGIGPFLDPLNKKLFSLRGEAELREGKRQLCIREQYPDKFIDQLQCTYQQLSEFDTRSIECAESLGMDIDKIKECAYGKQGNILIREEAKYNRAHGLEQNPNPYIFINENYYNGTVSRASLAKAICEEIPRHKNCQDLSQYKTQLKVSSVTDRRCNACKYLQRESIISFHRVFREYDYKTIDINSEEGQELLEKYNPEYESFLLVEGDIFSFPNSILLSSEIEELEVEEDVYLFEVPVIFANRIEEKGELDYFTNSLCPKGVSKALRIEALIETVPDANIRIHYFLNYDESTKELKEFNSGELEESKRQVCIFEKYPSKFWNYLRCIDTHITAGTFTEEQGIKCANSNEIDNSIIDSCKATTEEKLVSDYELIKEFQLYSSPSILVNNKYLLQGLTAFSPDLTFCQVNPKLSGCNALVTQEENNEEVK